MDAPTLQALTTVAGVTVATVAILAVLMPALNLSADASNRFGPLLAVVIGIVVAEAATATVITGAGRADYLLGAITGLFGGLAAVGTHQAVKHTIANQPRT